MARRAIGAMFFSIFGGAWLAFWSRSAYQGNAGALVLIGALTLALAAFAYRRYRLHKAALDAEAESPAQKKAGRAFNIINMMQWVLIIVGANGLARVGLSSWIVPLAILVIGLHFLPLAHIFSYRAHYYTGAALVLLALVYPYLAHDGPADPIGCFFAGVILWASALRALLVRPAAQLVPG